MRRHIKHKENCFDIALLSAYQPFVSLTGCRSALPLFRPKRSSDTTCWSPSDPLPS
ncbi:hypothetical protein BDV23DRAFT_150878 [Aspergillus alliaceus]|uniref:Uncharacterized protein n=1 Tax=Petromyces alliaceus TaxID=209559 RepID=A0A5N7CEV9_PETAA|nr:hypothetical protein BDV23DRAFT_150878 [Aspergillus alliaceus]